MTPEPGPNFDPPPPPPGTQELASIAEDLAPGRRLPGWMRVALIALALGWVLLIGGLFWMNARGLKEARAASTRLGPDGLWPVARPLDLGLRSAPRAVLLIHGFAGTPRDYEQFPEALAATGVRVVAPLLPGHGRTPLELAETDNAELLGAVLAAAAELRGQHAEVCIVGFSMGAALVAQASAETEFERMALVAPYFGIQTPAWALLRAETWAGLVDPPLRYLYVGPEAHRIADRSRGAEMPRYEVFPLISVRRLADLGRAASAPELLARIEEPALFVVAEQDGAADPARARTALDALGSTTKQLFEVHRSQHLLFYDYDAEAVAERLIGFLAPGASPVPSVQR